MPRIHLIERVGLMVPIDASHRIWQSGNWVMSAETARTLVGGMVFFHQRQDARSHFGGEITGYRVLGPDHAECGRVVLEFKPDKSCKGVLAGTEGWGMEMKLIR